MVKSYVDTANGNLGDGVMVAKLGFALAEPSMCTVSVLASLLSIHLNGVKQINSLGVVLEVNFDGSSTYSMAVATPHFQPISGRSTRHLTILPCDICPDAAHSENRQDSKFRPQNHRDM